MNDERQPGRILRCGGLIFIGVLAFVLAPVARGQTVAFPGALGFGAYATGGRGGTVYHVTTLADSGTGSFRDAVSHSGRIVVFDVGGHVTLASAVSVNNNITIAGQTAPGGISFDAGEVSFSPRANIICRYIRIRPGSATASTGDDALSLYKSTNCILDHCSLEFGPWNNIDAVTAHNISIQSCIDANPIYQQFGAHTENVGANFSWCYNLFANSHNRNPLAKINNVYVNNVLYNYQAGYTTHTSSKFKHDIVNNYFIQGPGSGSTDNTWYQMDANQSIYSSGNLEDKNKDGALNGSLTSIYWYNGTGTILNAPWSAWTSIIPTMSPDLAYRYALSTAGPLPRDDVDSLVLSQVKSLGTVGPGTGLYTSQTQTGLGNNGYGSITALAPAPDTDGDGMPDYWEQAVGSNPNSADSTAATADGYSLIEHYLNWLAAPHAVTQSNTPVDISLAQFTGGFSASSTFTLANPTNGTVSIINATNAHFVPNNNFTGLASFNFTVNDGGLTLSASVTVCVTPGVPPASATQFGGAIIGVSLTAAGPPANLTWRGDGIADLWNTASSNWLNGSAIATFKTGDVVTFDDTGSNSPAITLTNAVSPGATIFNINKNFTIGGGGALAGSGSFSKTGGGALTIGTTNSAFSGSITINGGALLLNPNTSLGTGAISLGGGATLNLLGGGTGTALPGAITIPAGDTVVIACGQLANSVSGNITSGDTATTLVVSNSTSFAGTSAQFTGFTGKVNILSGATLRFSANSSGNNYGSSAAAFTVTGTLQPRNAGNTVTLGTLTGTGTLTGPQSNAGTGNTVYNIGGGNTDSTFNGVITSTTAVAGSLVSLNKVGTGTLTLGGNSTFTGTNGVTAGTEIVNGSITPSSLTVFTNATLGGLGTITGAVTVNNGGKISPGAASTGTLTVNGPLTCNSPTMLFTLSGSPSGANDRINMTGALTLSGAQNFIFALPDAQLGTGTYGLVEGANNTALSSVTFTGNLPAYTRQTLQLTSSAAGQNPGFVRLIVSGPPAATNLVWQGAANYNWDFATANWASGAATDQFYNLDWVLFDDTGANAQPINLTTALSPAVIQINAAKNYTFSGVGSLAGPGALTKSGAGTLTINTTNSTYTGNVTVNGGTLAVASGANIGSGALTVASGGTFALPASGNSLFLGSTFTVPAGQTANITSGVLSSGFSGNFISGNTNSVLNIFGGVSFSGTSTAQFDGFTGAIHIQPGGSIRFSANSSGNNYGSASTAFTVDGTLQPRNAGNTVTLGSLAGAGTLAGPQSNSGSGDTLFTIGGNGLDSTFTGNISSNTAVAGSAVSLNKTGAGTLTLGGASTFTGGTTVSSGALRVSNPSGSATGSGDLEIFGGATLTGSGSIASATTIDPGATLAPGTLSISNNLTLNDSSLLQFTLGANSSSVAVGGALVLAGQLTVSAGAGFGPGAYTLFTSSGGISGALTLAGVPSGYYYSLTNTPTAALLVVTSTNPPPPVFTSTVINGGNIVISGSNGVPLGNCYVLASTNIALAMSNWTRLATNQFDASGNFGFTNSATNFPQDFFRLQLP